MKFIEGVDGQTWHRFVLEPHDLIRLNDSERIPYYLRHRFKQGKHEWVQGYTHNDSIGRDLQLWLRTHVGYQAMEYWEVDAPYFCAESELPDLNVDWSTTFRRIPFEERNWAVRRGEGSRVDLWLRLREHAILFKLVYGGAQ